MIDKLKSFFDRTFWRFIVVGVINTAFGTVVMFTFYNLLHFNYWVSSISNYFFGSILSYILNRIFTFENHVQIGKTLWRFALNICICYLLAYGAAKPLARFLLSGIDNNIQENIAMLFGMCFFVLLNYCGQRFFVFDTQRKS